VAGWLCSTLVVPSSAEPTRPSGGRDANAPEGREPQTTFSWRAPAGCPSEARVRAQIERHLRRRLDEVQTEVEKIEVVVSEQAGRLRLVVTTEAPLGSRSRELTHENCTSLANAASVIVAIALDPAAVEHLAEDIDPATSEADSTPGETTTPPSETPPPKVTTSTRGDVPQAGDEVDAKASTRDASRATLYLSAGAAGQTGVLPQPGLGVDVAVGLCWPSLVVAVHGDYWTPQRYVFSDLPGANVDIELWTVGAFAGPRFGGSVWRWIPLGAGFELGAMAARPEGLERERTSRSLWAGATLASSFEWMLTK
jgi:hypothetical protein